MSWQQLKQLNEEIGEVGKELNRMNEACFKEKRDFSTEETTKFKDLNDKLNAKTLRKQAVEAEMSANHLRQSNPGEGEDRKGPGPLDRFMRFGAEELSKEERATMIQKDQRAMTVAGIGTVGDQVFYNQVTEKLKFFSGLRQAGATVITTADGNKMPIPILDGTALEARYVTETGTRNESTAFDGIFDTTAELDAFAMTTDIIPVSRNLVQDSKFDIMGWVSMLAGEMLGRKESRETTVGVGGGAAVSGIVGSATLAQTTSGAAMTYDDLLDLQNKLDAAYTQAVARCRYLAHQDVATSLRKLKDTTGRPIWQPAFGGNPEMVNGYALQLNNHLGNYSASGNVCALFGDFSKYLIRDVAGLFIQRLDQDAQLVRKGMIGYIVERRMDGRLLDTGAVAKLIRA